MVQSACKSFSNAVVCNRRSAENANHVFCLPGLVDVIQLSPACLQITPSYKPHILNPRLALKAPRTSGPNPNAFGVWLVQFYGGDPKGFYRVYARWRPEHVIPGF